MQSEAYRGAKIQIINDPGFETCALPRKAFNRAVAVIFSVFPGFISKLIIHKSHEKARHVHVNVTNHAALETLYTSGHDLRLGIKNRLVKDIIENAWFNLDNARAVRNRLRIVRSLIAEEAEKRIRQGKKSIYILSLASGSARAVLEAAYSLEKRHPELWFDVLLIDRSEKALACSRDLAKTLGIKNIRYRTVQGHVRSFARHCRPEEVDIVEVVGLCDYLDQDKCRLLFGKIYASIAPGASLITANIRDNFERAFIERALSWRMVYREPETLIDAALEAGFCGKKTALYLEPLLIHSVLKAEK